MKRRMIMVVSALALATLALAPAMAAGGPGSIELTSPAAGAFVGPSTTITWDYTTGTSVLSTSTVQVEVKAGGPVYELIGTAPITAGSLAWDASAAPEASTYNFRITVVGTNKQDTADGVTLDKTPPTIEVVVDPSACEAPAWCSAAAASVTVTASDASSGLAVDPSGVTEVTAEGPSSLSFTATDNVGNSATASVDVQIDRGAPSIEAIVAPAGCEAPSWCNADAATITVNAADAISGLAVDPSGTYEITDEGITSRSFTATDLAGNSASVGATVQIDRTGPTTLINAMDVPLVLNVLDGAITGTAMDNLSGVASTRVTFVDVLGASTVLDATCADCPMLNTTWSVSTASLQPGLYTVTAASTDVAGNDGAASAPVQVLIV